MYIEKCVALLNDEEVYRECRDQAMSIHSKVVRQLLDLRFQFDTNLRNNIINFALQMTTSPGKILWSPKNT